MIIVFNAAKIMMIAIQTKEIKDFSSTHITFSVNLKNTVYQKVIKKPIFNTLCLLSLFNIIQMKSINAISYLKVSQYALKHHTFIL